MPLENLLTDGTNSYVFDAENRISFRQTLVPPVTSTTPDGNRVPQAGSVSDWTEYIYFPAEVLSLRGSRTATTAIMSMLALGRNHPRRHLRRWNSNSRNKQHFRNRQRFSISPMLVDCRAIRFRTVTKLLFRQYQNSVARGGIFISFLRMVRPLTWVTYDQDGQQINSDNTTNAWHYRRVGHEPVDRQDPSPPFSLVNRWKYSGREHGPSFMAISFNSARTEP